MKQNLAARIAIAGMLGAAALLPMYAHAEEQRGMPQLNVHDFAPQLVWLAITFIALYVLMAWVGLPRVGVALEARRNRIDGDLARASQVKTEAEAVLAAYQKGVAEARAQAQATLKATTDRLAAEAAQRQRELGEQLAQQIGAAEARIAAMKDEALAEVRGIAVDVGRAIVEKLTGAIPDGAKLAAAVDRTLAGAAAERVH
jgi:F-type H+-transporting ATPase subunit b